MYTSRHHILSSSYMIIYTIVFIHHMLSSTYTSRHHILLAAASTHRHTYLCREMVCHVMMVVMMRMMMWCHCRCNLDTDCYQYYPCCTQQCCVTNIEKCTSALPTIVIIVVDVSVVGLFCLSVLRSPSKSLHVRCCQLSNTFITHCAWNVIRLDTHLPQ